MVNDDDTCLSLEVYGDNVEIVCRVGDTNDETGEPYEVVAAVAINQIRDTYHAFRERNKDMDADELKRMTWRHIAQLVRDHNV